MESRRRIRVPLILARVFIVAFVFTELAGAATEKKVSSKDKDQLTKFVTLLQSEKNRAEDFVLRAKQINEDENRQEARRLYERAETDFNHYLTEIFNAVRLGSHPDLSNSSKVAHDSTAAFENYVEVHTTSKSPTVVIAGAKTVLEMGINLLNWFSGTAGAQKTQMDKLRRETADYWQPRLEWKAWDKISAGG